MTDDEARSLKPGDVVIFKAMHKNERRRMIVDCVRDYGSQERVRVVARKPGFRVNGRRNSRVIRVSSLVSFVSHAAPATANVYADWLEERGEYRAAQMLREAFPFEDGKA